MPRDASLKNLPKASMKYPLTPSVEKKLLGYAALASAAGVGVLALAQSSEAEVVYTPTDQRILGGTTLQLDLNGDGINDFSFQARSSPGQARGGVGTFSTRSGAAVLAYPAIKTNQIWGTVGLVSVLPLGVVLSRKGKFGINEEMGGVSALNGGPPTYAGPWAPAGKGLKNQYVGFKFVIGGKFHYGWARFNMRMRLPRQGGLEMVLTGYAYETVANKPIVTGETKGADLAEAQAKPQPQPATLGRLAQGTPGLTAWRREYSEIGSGSAEI